MSKMDIVFIQLYIHLQLKHIHIYRYRVSMHAHAHTYTHYSAKQKNTSSCIVILTRTYITYYKILIENNAITTAVAILLNT